MAKYVSQEKQLFEKAFDKFVPRKVILTPQQSLELQSALHLSHSGLREFRRQVKTLKLPFGIASASKMQSELAKYFVDSSYYEGVELEGTGGKVLSLVYAASVPDIVARDLDHLIETEAFHDWKFKCNEHRTLPTISAVISNDWGGWVRKVHSSFA